MHDNLRGCGKLTPWVFGIVPIALTPAARIGLAADASALPEPRLTSELIHDAFSVFSLTIAQDHSLGVIQETYPDLRTQVLEARLAFERAFTPAVEATDAYLSKAFGREWQGRKEGINRAVRQVDHSALSRAEALRYIETVNRRTKGDMPHRIYIVLSTLHPTYLQHPHFEFVRGYIREYRTDGSGKASGLKIGLQYPMSWHESEGRRPHVVRKFSTHDSFASSMLLVKELPEASSSMTVKEALEYLSSREYLEAELPDAHYLSSGTSTIASQPSSFVNYTRSVSRTISSKTIGINTRGRLYFIVYRGTLVVLSLDVSDVDNGIRELETEFRRRESLFDLMAHSFEIYNKYP